MPKSLSLKNESKSAPTKDDSDFSSGGTSEESSNTASDIEDYGLKSFNVDQNEILPLQKNQSDKTIDNNEIVFPAYENPSLKDSKKRVKMT